MARMIPNTLDLIPETTAGERKLFDLLKKLPESCIVRYEMLLGERDYRPDYAVVSPEHGITILEVKDWGVENIVNAGVLQFMVKGYHGSSIPRPQPNPDHKCQIYLRDARNHLVAMPELLDEADHLAIAPRYFVVFPNISRAEFAREELGKVINPENVFVREDVASAATFLKRYQDAVSTLPKPLTEKQMSAISAALLPDIVIPHVIPGLEKAGAAKIVTEGETVETYNLSLEQEDIAKSLGEGPRLLRGIAGTGKTLIMLYRAKMLATNREDARILILCWNVSLGNYMRQVYDKMKLEAKGQVSIYHFNGFVKELLARHKRPAISNLDDDEFVDELRRLKIVEADRFDAVYIDEAQDFRSEWIKFIYDKLLKGEPSKRNLLIAADDAQRIYQHRHFSWAGLGIPMVGRSKVLRTIYRNSKKVWTFAALLVGEDSVGKAIDGEPISDKLVFASRGDYDPVLIECPTKDRQMAQAVDIIRRMSSDGFAARNVLILYKGKGQDGLSIEKFKKELKSAEIPADWITEDKHNFDWQANRIKVSTVASAKGMDSPIVIVMGAEAFGKTEASLEDDRRLLYVALTRAREVLVVLYSSQGGLVPKLRECEQQYAEIAASL